MTGPQSEPSDVRSTIVFDRTDIRRQRAPASYGGNYSHLSWAIPILFWFLFVTPASSQTLPFTSYSIQEGLSESVVHDIIQDQHGYLWIGTGFGLNRYDGRSFTKYYQQNGLPDNRVNVILQASGGELYVGTQRGLAVLDRLSNDMTSNAGAKNTFRLVNQESPLSRSIVMDLAEGPDRTIWVATQHHGLWKIHEGKTEQIKFQDTALTSASITALLPQSDGSLWIGTSEALFYLENAEKPENIRQILVENESAGNIRDIKSDSDGRILAATAEGLLRQTTSNPKTPSNFQRYGIEDGLTSPSLHSLAMDSDGRWWIGSDEGAFLFQEAELQAHSMQSHETNQNPTHHTITFRQFTTSEGLSAKLVYSVMYDREGNVWMGTLGGGLNKFYGEIFLNYDVSNGLKNNVVTGFEESRDGTIWIATFGGGMQSFQNDTFTIYGESEGLTDSKLYVIQEVKDGSLWIGGEKGLQYYKDGKFIKPDQETFPYTHVRSIYEDSKNNQFWIGTYYDGLVLYNEDRGVLKTYDTSNVLNNHTVMDIKRDSLGVLWFATYGGAVSYDGNEWVHYTAEDGLPSNGVVQIHIDSKNRIWFSTFEGIAYLNGDTLETPSGEEQTGIITYFTLQDDYQQYWLGTNRGMVRFQPDRYQTAVSEVQRIKAFKLYNREQGLVANELNAGAYLKASDGSLWLGTIEGLSIFRPGLLRENLQPPGIELKQVTAGGRQVALKSDTTAILEYDQNYIRFNYIGLSHESPGRILYRYRLEGFEDTWQTTRDVEISYASLPPGRYSFHLQSFNADGIASKSAIDFNFRIRAPFWMQLWFIGMISLTFFGLIFLYLRYLSVNKQIEIERMRVQIASDLHDDVGSSLTELALQTDMLQHKEKDPLIKSTLRKLGEQSRRIVSGLDDIVWSIDSRNDKVGDLTDRMQDYVTHIFKSGTPDVHYAFDRLDMSEKLPVQVKENIYLVFKEAIHNIAKHSDATDVHVQFSMHGRNFHLSVKDNGTGATDSQKTRRSGQGMRNMELRARRINARLNIFRDDGFRIDMKGTL